MSDRPSEALKAAVAAIYFADSSDYLSPCGAQCEPCPPTWQSCWSRMKARHTRKARSCNQLHRAEYALKMVEALREGKDTAYTYDVPFV